VNVSQVGRQDGQAALHVLTRPIPLDQRFHGKLMPKIVKTRSMTIGRTTQSNLPLGLIVTGANSKRQPELATFSERLLGQVVHMPISTRLQMADGQDRLSLAYNTFFSDLYVPPPSETEFAFRFVIAGKGRPAEDPKLTLQICLKAGEPVETGGGKKFLADERRVELSSAELGGWIRHHGWTLHLDPGARLVWPVYPHNPYADAPETSLEYAVAALSADAATGKVRKTAGAGDCVSDYRAVRSPR